MYITCRCDSIPYYFRLGSYSTYPCTRLPLFNTLTLLWGTHWLPSFFICLSLSCWYLLSWLELLPLRRFSDRKKCLEWKPACTGCDYNSPSSTLPKRAIKGSSLSASWSGSLNIWIQSCNWSGSWTQFTECINDSWSAYETHRVRELPPRPCDFIW